MIENYEDVFTYLEFIQTKLKMYKKELKENELNYKLFKEFIIKDIDNNLDILFKEWHIDLMINLSDSNTTKTIEEFIEDLEWLYKEIDKAKYSYLED